MFEELSVSAQSRPRHPRRAARLMWAIAVFAAVAFGYGSGVAQTLNGPTSITATPEDPCLMDNTCGEENQVPGVETPGEEVLVQCEELHSRGIFTPECSQIN